MGPLIFSVGYPLMYQQFFRKFFWGASWMWQNRTPPGCKKILETQYKANILVSIYLTRMTFSN